MRKISELFESLADENRLRIVNMLLASPYLVVGDLQRILDIPQTRVSRHLAYLRNRGIVHFERNGLWVRYRLSDDFRNNPELINGLRSMFSRNERALLDIELLLEGLDENTIIALQNAPDSTIESVIEHCCTMGHAS